MRILVTGGSGFIGGHLVERLIKEGHEVSIFDMNFPIYALEGFDDSKFTMGSIFMEEEVSKSLEGMDMVFHLAALANTNMCADYPVAAVMSNCIGTAKILDACKKHKIQRVFIASSSLVSDQLFGDDGQVYDDDLIELFCSTGHIYTSTKLFTEMLAKNFYTMYQLPYTILRFGICYGPRMTEGVVVDTFIRNVLADQPMCIDGDGEQWRYYMHVDDLVEGCIKALSPVAANSTYNLIPEWKTTINQIAEVIQYNLGGEIKHRKNRKFDFTLKELYAGNDLDWEASIGLMQGIKDTVKWYLGSGKVIWNA